MWSWNFRTRQLPNSVWLRCSLVLKFQDQTMTKQCGCCLVLVIVWSCYTGAWQVPSRFWCTKHSMTNLNSVSQRKLFWPGSKDFGLTYCQKRQWILLDTLHTPPRTAPPGGRGSHSVPESWEPLGAHTLKRDSDCNTKYTCWFTKGWKTILDHIWPALSWAMQETAQNTRIHGNGFILAMLVSKDVQQSSAKNRTALTQIIQTEYNCNTIIFCSLIAKRNNV